MKHYGDKLDQGWNSESVGMRYVAAAISRQARVLMAVPLAFITAAFFYIVTTPPQYSSSALLYFDIQRDETDQMITVLSSHAVAIASAEMTGEVINQLSLHDRFSSEFSRFDRLVHRLRVIMRLEVPADPNDEEALQIKVSRASANLDVSRVGDTSILRITYTSKSKTDASNIANAYANFYLNRMLSDARKSVVRRAELLESRAAEAIRNSTDAYQSAQKLRSEASADLAGIAEFDARVTELKNRLSEHDVEIAALRARLELISPENEYMAMETTAFQLDGGERLYAALTDASKRLNILQNDPNAGGTVLSQLENSVDGLRSAFDDLMRRSRNELNRELLVLEARRASFQRNLNELLQQSSTSRWSDYIIAEHRADVYRKVHANQLAELEALHGRSLEVHTRILAKAQPSVEASWPDPKLILVLAAVGGVLFAAGVAMWREWLRAGNHSQQASL